MFKLKENGTTVRTEIVAGLTTFMTMAYIIALNPNLLTGFGSEGQNLWNGVFMATCIASAIGMFVITIITRVKTNKEVRKAEDEERGNYEVVAKQGSHRKQSEPQDVVDVEEAKDEEPEALDGPRAIEHKKK